ncbi:hypothetical protein B0J11DRAFT_16238 [Dendryphion nanum]|uniref:Uncharacterized protein n=1 Tax=Dendryphion nanum TaxID=256645 RepID=A0A9P9J198_9PLEO|nr:hypothetical protein B0J11DRAFT_16238 [Dendryphion nanum]
MYYGKHVEPLAFSLVSPFSTSPIKPQHDSQLVSLPTEIKSYIWEYALTDTTSCPPFADNRWRRDHVLKGNLPKSDVAVALLATCKLIYLSTYKLPFLLNPFIVYGFGTLPSYDITRPSFVELHPWQFGLIQKLDISLQQVGLEGASLSRYLETWRAQERHTGAVIAPRFYQETRGKYPNAPVTHSFNFGLIQRPPLSSSVRSSSFQGVSITTFKSPDKSLYPTGTSSIPYVLAMPALPLTHLTLRLSRTDWWTWGDPPSSTSSAQQLGLDPAFGDGGSGDNERPVHHRMIHLATQRRTGQWPNPYYKNPAPTHYMETWGAAVGKLQDLKCLELVLETFAAKEAQLDVVVGCAETWRFPLDGVGAELVWDGNVEKGRYRLNEYDWYYENDSEGPVDGEENGSEMNIDEDMGTRLAEEGGDDSASVASSVTMVNAVSNQAESDDNNEEEEEEDSDDYWAMKNPYAEVRIIRFKRARV